MALLDLIEKAINEHGSAAIMKERLELIREQVQVLERKSTMLDEENSALKRTIMQLEEQLAAKTVHEEFVECRGALFKRKAGGGYHQAVYCPKCHGPMVSVNNITPFLCSPCSVLAGFTGRQLTKVMKEIEQ